MTTHNTGGHAPTGGDAPSRRVVIAGGSGFIGSYLRDAFLAEGSTVIRTETELVLKSRWVVPERMLDAGYVFEYPDLTPALVQIIGQRSLLRVPATS